MENLGIFLTSPEAIFSHDQLQVVLSKVQLPDGLKVMVCGGSTSSSGGAWVKNVVYREAFHNHLGYAFPSTQDSTSFMDIPFPCSPLVSNLMWMNPCLVLLRESLSRMILSNPVAVFTKKLGSSLSYIH